MKPHPAGPPAPRGLRAFQARLPLAGDPPNALLSLLDDRFLSLAAVLPDTPQPAPALSPKEWQAFFDRLVPHGAFPAPGALTPSRARGLPAAGGGHGPPEPRLPLRGREIDAGRPREPACSKRNGPGFRSRLQSAAMHRKPARRLRRAFSCPHSPQSLCRPALF